MNAVDNLKVIFTQEQKAELTHDDFDFSLCADHEIIGKVLVSVISSGSERGGYMNYFGGNTYPCETGYAAVAKVLRVGSAVTTVNPGDLIFSQAPHQLYVRVTDDNIVAVPPDMPPEHAVLCRFPAVSMTSMLHTSIRPVEPIVVTGLGVVGLTCAQMMEHCGYEVYAVDPSALRCQTAEACGLRHVFSSIESIPGLKGKAGAVFECSGSEQATFGAFDYLRKGGEIFLIGVPWRRTTEVYAHDLLVKIFNGFLKVHSGWEWSLPLHAADFTPYSNYGSFETAMGWIRDGFIRVDSIYELADPKDCDAIYQRIANNQLVKTCAIFDWRNY